MKALSSSLQKPIFIFTLFSVLVLSSQLWLPGISKGHRAWMQSQHIAMARNSTIDNYAVGSPAYHLNDDGSRRPEYLSRAPFVFGFLSSFILSPIEKNLSLSLYLGQQMMNLIFLLTALITYFLFKPLIKDRLKLLTVLLLLFGSHYFISYKDMFDPNRLGSLSMALSLLAIQRYWLYRKTTQALLLMALAACLGEASPAIFSSVLFFTFFAVYQLKQKNFLLPNVKNIILSVPTLMILIAASFTAFFIFYQAWVESQMANISLFDSGLFASIKRRFSFSDGTASSHATGFFAYLRNFSKFLNISIQPYFVSFFTVYLSPASVFGWILKILAVLLNLVFLFFGFRGLAKTMKSTDNKFLMWLIFSSGLFYFLLMKDLVHYHDFTYTYLLGFLGLFFLSFVQQMQKWFSIKTLFYLVCIANVFALAFIQYNNHQRTKAFNEETHHYEKIQKTIPKKQYTLFVPEGRAAIKPGVRFAPDFYFPGVTYTSRLKDAKYIFSKNPINRDLPLVYQSSNHYLYINPDYE